MLAEFEDRNGRKCCVQESSIASEACIWFGVVVDLHGQEVNARMHLTQQQVHNLLPLLRHFARNGTLGTDDPKEIYQVGTWVIGVGETNRGILGRIVEVAKGRHVVVQDEQVPGEAGQIVCMWDKVDLVWDPTTPPVEEYVQQTRLDRLLSDEEETDDPGRQ